MGEFSNEEWLSGNKKYQSFPSRFYQDIRAKNVTYVSNTGCDKLLRKLFLFNPKSFPYKYQRYSRTSQINWIWSLELAYEAGEICSQVLSVLIYSCFLS